MKNSQKAIATQLNKETFPHTNLAEAYSASLSARVLYCLDEGTAPVLEEEVWGVE